MARSKAGGRRLQPSCRSGGAVLLQAHRGAHSWPDTKTPIYANVLGAALIGLSLAVLFAANHPESSRDTILASIVAKVLAGVVIVYWVFLAGIELPSPWLLPAAVVVQVLFVLGEAAYVLSRPND